jgi:serine/threonine protein kinase
VFYHAFLFSALNVAQTALQRCVEKATGKAYALKIMDKSKTKVGSTCFDHRLLSVCVCVCVCVCVYVSLFSVCLSLSLSFFLSFLLAFFLAFFLSVSDAVQGMKETKMVENEVNVMRSVDHPNIIKLVDVFDTPSHLFLVLELMESGDLFDRVVSKGKYSEAEAAVLVHSLATAVYVSCFCLSLSGNSALFFFFLSSIWPEMSSKFTRLAVPAQPQHHPPRSQA